MSTDTKAEVPVALLRFLDEKCPKNQTIDCNAKTLAKVGRRSLQDCQCGSSLRPPSASHGRQAGLHRLLTMPARLSVIATTSVKKLLMSCRDKPEQCRQYHRR